MAECLESSESKEAVETAAAEAPSCLGKMKRWLLSGLGFLFFGLAVLGAFLPILPTTPFILVSAALFARSSKRAHERILQSPLFGPTVRRWQETGSISRRAKFMAVTMLLLAILVSAILVAEAWWLRPVLALTAFSVSAFIISRPTAP